MKRPVWLAIVPALLICTAAVAQAPQVMPQLVVHAQYVYVTTYDGPAWSDKVMPEDRKAVGDVVIALQKWGRYMVVYRPEEADVILIVQRRSNGDTLAVYNARQGVSSIPLWREMKQGGLDSNELPLLTQFRKAVEAGGPHKH